MGIDTNESLEMIVEADADAAGKELDELITKLGEVIAQLKKVKSPSQQGLIPGLQDAMGNIMNLRKQIAGLNIRRAKFSPDSKGWKQVDAQISEANYQLDKFVATANDLIGKALTPEVDTSKIAQAVQDIQIYGLEQTKENIPLYDGALSPPVEFDWDAFNAENEAHLKDFESFLNRFDDKDIEIRVEFTSELAQAQKHVTALENAIERNKHNMRKYQISGDENRLMREAAALRTNEALLKRYEDAIRSASGAWSHMDDAGTIEIRNVEDYERVERAAKRLEKSIENDTAAMRRFSAANDAAGVERMKARIEGSAVALDRYNKAMNGATGIGKQRDQMRQLQSLYADIEKIQKRINNSTGGDRMFVNNTASVRRLKLELMQAQMETRRLKKILGEGDTGGAFRQSAKYIGMSLINMVKLRAEAKRGKKAVIDMSRALSLMAFRMAIRTVMRLTKEGIQNLAKFSHATDNVFNGAMSRMMSKVTELKNSFAASIAPVIQAIEPYVVKIANYIISAFNRLSLLMASLFGQKTFYKAIPIAENYAKSLDGAASSAKKLQKQLMGIDELTVLQDPNSGASGGAAAGRADPAEMFTIEKVADHQDTLDNMKQRLNELMPLIVTAGALFAAWKIAPAVINGLETVNRLTDIIGAKPVQLLGGGALVLGGGLLEGYSIADAIENGLDGLNFAGILGGGGVLTGGAALIGKALGSTIIGAAVGGIVAGVPAFATGVYDAITDGLDTTNALLIAGSATAIGASIGSLIAPGIGTAIGAAIGLAVGGLTDLGILIYENEDLQAKWSKAGEDYAKGLEESAKAWSEFTSGFRTDWEKASDDYVKGIEESGKAWSDFTGGFKTDWQNARDDYAKGLDESYNNFSTKIGKMKTTIGGWFSNVRKGWDEAGENYAQNLEDMQAKLGEWKEKAGQKWEDFKNGIKGKLDEAWKKVSEFFSISAWKQKVDEAVKAIKDNFKMPEFPKIKLEVTYSTNVGNLKRIVYQALGLSGWPTLKWSAYAEGGFPSMGEMFIARERGPELVGRMGSRNVVANNDQIVQGIAYGVAEANDALISVVYAVTQQVIQAINDKELNTYIDTKKITTAQHQRSRAYGV